MTIRIENSVIYPHSKEERAFFHPKVAFDIGKQKLAMTLQTINGSDYFGPVHVTYSEDNGKVWEKPQKLLPLNKRSFQEGIIETVCDVVPDYHPQHNKLLAIGHNAYYSNTAFIDTFGFFKPDEKAPSLQRFSVYSVKDSYGNWSERKRISFGEFKDFPCFVCGCSQKVILTNGQMIIPSVIGGGSRRDFKVVCLLCDFDGIELKPVKRGNILELPVDRGLLEPSIIQYNDSFFLTLRAEDGHGYLSTSDDGLHWEPIRAWSWENGSKLIMSTTQQHWLKLGGKLYLVYTRKNGENRKVMRWRAPLLIAEFDTENLCLKKDTEQVVFPMKHHPENPDSVGLMGNFHPLSLSENEAIITVGEMHPEMNFKGDTLLARLTVK
jgi:hypothetical protein